MLDIILIFLLFAFLFGGIGTFPTWEYSHGYGYGPSGLMFVLFVVLLVYVLRGRGV